MTCEDRSNLIPLYLTDGLEPAEREQLRAHLASGCPRCAGALAEWEATFSAIPLGLDPAAPSPEIRMKLLDNLPPQQSAAGSMRIAPELKPPAARKKLGAIRPMAIAATLTAVVASLIIWIVLRDSRSTVDYLVVRNAEQRKEIAGLQEQMKVFEQSVEMFRSPDLRIYALAGSAAQPQATARAYWDPARNVWRLEATNLKPLAPGRAYQLWYIPPGQGAAPIPSETFTVDATGNGTLVTRVKPGVRQIALAAITEEPAGGSMSPTTTPFLVGGPKAQ